MSLQTAQNPGDQLYIISNFSVQDPDRVATPLVLANCALAADSDVVLWLTMDGVELAYNEVFARFGTMFFNLPGAAMKNIRSTVKSGGKFTQVV